MVAMRRGMGSMARAADDDRKPYEGVTAPDGTSWHDGVNGDDEAAVRWALFRALAAIEGPRARVDGILLDSDDGESGDQQACG
jgi:hypothetical protein